MHSQTPYRSFNSRGLRQVSLIVVAALGLIAGSCIQAAEPAPASAELDALFRNYIEMLRADLKTGKVVIYSRIMQLSDSEAKVFWPIYQQYETALFALGDRRLTLIKKFANSYEKQNLDDATAQKLYKERLARQEDQNKMWKKD